MARLAVLVGLQASGKSTFFARHLAHTHLHVIPTTDMRQLDFANAARTVDRSDLEAAAAALAAELR